MTIKQKQVATEALAELQALAPGVKWRVTWNYYTKLPEFTAMRDGAVQFSMYKREEYKQVTNEWGVTYKRPTGRKYAELSATYDPTTHETERGMIVSGAHDWDKLPSAEIKQELPRLNFKAYLQFIKDNLGMLERIGA